MPVDNRELGSGVQANVVQASLTKTITGQTYALCVVPYPAQLMAVQQCVAGLSGAPNHSIWLQRFVVGSGVTSVNIGNSLVSQVFGTSGAQGFSIPAGASNLLQAGDIVMLSTAAANTACESATVTLVLKSLQDIRTNFGV